MKKNKKIDLWILDTEVGEVFENIEHAKEDLARAIYENMEATFERFVTEASVIIEGDSGEGKERLGCLYMWFESPTECGDTDWMEKEINILEAVKELVERDPTDMPERLEAAKILKERLLECVQMLDNLQSEEDSA